MAEYINREDALEFPFANGIYDHEHANEHFISGCESYREWIASIPAADVVERKAGVWIGEGDGYADGNMVYDMWSCGCCGTRFYEWEEKPTWKYCPVCGSHNGGDEDV